MKHSLHTRYCNIKWETRIVTSMGRVLEVIQMVLSPNGAKLSAKGLARILTAIPIQPYKLYQSHCCYSNVGRYGFHG